ncbi:hypothetical protein BDV98DRAFT_564225 [Pterulicium gracile]|uniref:Uncharacterized protein n=1 Tax=Pterulicium gracile TaxID=1884261 RepID=A0A5C3QNE2_9AGAR|nr:hypothetical protein BDV98DRAFT_564225 [Pterula gracilis]
MSPKVVEWFRDKPEHFLAQSLCFCIHNAAAISAHVARSEVPCNLSLRCYPVQPPHLSPFTVQPARSHAPVKSALWNPNTLQGAEHLSRCRHRLQYALG